jgi:hypothetical protein
MTEQAIESSSGRLLPNSPAFFASVFGILIGVALIGFAAYLMSATNTPIAMDLALIVIGLSECAASFYTLQRMRVAWSFALSLNGTAFVVFLFSAPRIRDAAEVSIAVALVPCLIFGALVLMHSLHSEEF